MNQIRIMRLRGKDREEYVRTSLKAMKIQTLRHIMAESGVPHSNNMRKEEMVSELTVFLCEWAERVEILGEFRARSEV
jgi:hypothetical protein